MAIDLNLSRYGTLGVPPDSSGKKFGTTGLVVIEYSPGANPVAAGDLVVGDTSSFAGFVRNIDPRAGINQLSVLAVATSPVQVPSDGEGLEVSSLNIGTVVSTEVVYTQGTTLASGENPLNLATIDDAGSQYVRFREGDQQLDAFGLSRTSTPRLLGTYTFRYGTNADEWYDETVGGGSTITHLPNEASVALDADTGASDLARRTTNVSHIYHPSYSQKLSMTVVCGDSGKANNQRSWGLYDANDGVFFRLNGTTLEVVIRSSTSGSAVDTAVAQSNWNGDKADGTGLATNLSGMNIDVTNLNIYWIDFQWLGGGRVRFGVITPDGSRITLHSFENANSQAVPWCKNPSLPIRVESTNTGVSASPSRLKMTCAAVASEGQFGDSRSRKSVKWTVESATDVSVPATSGEVPILSFRSKTTINSRTNHKVSIPEKITVRVKTADAILRVARGVTLTGSPSWTSVSAAASAEYDTAATGISASETIVPYILGIGTHDISLPNNFGEFSENMQLPASGTQEVWSITVEAPDTGTTTDVTVFSTWIDVGIS